MNYTKEDLVKAQELIDEHGYMTGQEFLDITNNNMPLYWAYLAIWDNIVMPDIVENINKEYARLGGDPKDLEEIHGDLGL